MSLRRRRDIWDVVVIGGGISGLMAAWNCARRGMPTALLEAEGLFGGQVATVNQLDDYPSSSELSGADLALSLRERLENHSVGVYSETANAVKTPGGNGLLLVETPDRTLRTRRVIAAAGAKLRPLDVAGEAALRGRGVSQCAHCDGHFFKGQDVVVVGGGDAALQEALVLAPLAKSVTVVVRGRLKAKQAYVERAASASNVRFVWDTEVEGILGNGSVHGVRLKNVKSGEQQDLACTGVFPFIGVDPNTAFLPQSVRRDERGLVQTDERMRTSEPTIFAIGALRAGYSGELACAAGEATVAASAISADLSR